MTTITVIGRATEDPSRVRQCAFTGCKHPVSGHGLCDGHRQQRRAGRELAPLMLRRRRNESIRAFLGRATVQDSESGCDSWTGGLTAAGYARVTVNGREQYAHRLSWQLANGPIPSGMKVDHTCRNTSCVNPDHLRLATHAENLQNLALTGQRNNTSGFRGVTYDRSRGKYAATVTVQGTTHHIGRFNTAEEAGYAAIEARERLMPFATDIDQLGETA